MAWFNKSIKETPTISLDVKPSMYFGESVIKKLTEQFRGEVQSKKVTFPAELGEEHPFDFKQMEQLYRKFGFFTAVVDKYIDFVVGPGFYIEVKDDRAKEILETFIKDVNFDTILRQWTKEALIKGNGFLEIGGSKKEGVKGLKILNANYMYVNRDKKGKIEGYNQYKGGFDKFAKEKIISFNKDEIAHVPFNIVGDDAYGIGIGYSAMKIIDDWLSMNRSEHKLMDRKANAPLHAKLGYIDGDTRIIPNPEDVSAFGKDIENMSNKTEWATDPLVEFKVIDFGNIGDKFEQIMTSDLQMMMYAFQIPPVIMGIANVPEGLAKVQMEAFQRRIQSIQAELEKIIEQNIFKRVLQANGLDVDVEFEWGTPSIMETEGRMNLIAQMMASPTISGAMNKMLEDEMINLLKFDKDEWEKLKLEQEKQEEEERKRLEAQPQPIVPGQNKSFPQKPAPKAVQPKQPRPEEMLKEVMDRLKEMEKKIGKKVIRKPNIIPDMKVEKIIKKRMHKNYEYEKDCPHCTEAYDDMNDIQEWLGFNYKKFLGKIGEVLSKYDFGYIKAINEIELAAGYLSDTQVEALRDVLDNGFKKGQGLKEMAKQIDKKVQLKDLYRMTEDGQIKLGTSGLPILSRSAEKRAIAIARSEVTKVANEGAVEYYKENGIDKVSWVASIGNRTCPECEGLDGQIFEINSHPEIPLHPLCRCTLSPVVDLK